MNDSENKIEYIIQVYINYDLHREKLNERRSARNNFFMSFLTFLLTTLFALSSAKNIFEFHKIFYISMGLVGFCICILWHMNLTAISERISVIYSVIKDIEKRLPIAPYTDECDKLNLIDPKGYVKIIAVEKYIPALLGFGFLAVVGINLTFLI